MEAQQVLTIPSPPLTIHGEHEFVYNMFCLPAGLIIQLSSYMYGVIGGRLWQVGNVQMQDCKLNTKLFLTKLDR